LVLTDIPQPKPGPGQLLVRVRATALNRADILQRKGLYPPPQGESPIPGLEIAGEVKDWGEGVEDVANGMRVFGLVGGGGYAEYALLDRKMAMTVPDSWDFAQAAAVPEVYLTAHETLFHLAGLQPGETVLIHAGGSGVGTACIQMARHAQTTIYITAGSDEKIKRALDLGADAGINYKTSDFQKEIHTLTGGKGVDVVEDFIGAKYLAANMEVLKPGGRMILAALMGGNKAEIDLGTVLRKRLRIIGSVMRSRSLEEKRLITERFSSRWLPLMQSGEIKPVIDSTFPLEAAREAHEYMEANRNFGKIILTLD